MAGRLPGEGNGRKTPWRRRWQEDSLEKEMATHPRILAWEIPRTEEPRRLHSPWGRRELDTTYQLNNSKYIKQINYKGPTGQQGPTLQRIQELCSMLCNGR